MSIESELLSLLPSSHSNPPLYNYRWDHMQREKHLSNRNEVLAAASSAAIAKTERLDDAHSTRCRSPEKAAGVSI